jgi:hypothetical protein
LFSASDYSIHEKKDEGKTIELARLQPPSVDTLLRHRPQIREKYNLDQKKYPYSDVIEGIESKISTAVVSGNKIWFGFSFYEGEFFEGLGGLGFYDTKSKKLGILRHPALVDCSITSLSVSREKIYAATRGFHEASETVCNGLVVIERRGLNAESYVPRGGRYVKVFSEAEPGSRDVAGAYNKPLSELLKNIPRFTAKSSPPWTENQTKKVAALGPDRFMIFTADEESGSGP